MSLPCQTEDPERASQRGRPREGPLKVLLSRSLPASVLMLACGLQARGKAQCPGGRGRKGETFQVPYHGVMQRSCPTSCSPSPALQQLQLSFC